MVEKDRGMRRYREEGRFSNAPDTKQQGLAWSKAEDIPTLMLLRQNGEEAKGWRGLPLWWPVIVTPPTAATAIFATDEAVAPTAPAPSAAQRDRWQQKRLLDCAASRQRKVLNDS